MTFFIRRFLTSLILVAAAFGGATAGSHASSVSAVPTIVYTAYHDPITTPDQSNTTVGSCNRQKGCWSAWVQMDGFTPGSQMIEYFTYPGGSGSGSWILASSSYGHFALLGQPCPTDGTFQGNVQDALTGDTAAYSAPISCTRVKKH